MMPTLAPPVSGSPGSAKRADLLTLFQPGVDQPPMATFSELTGVDDTRLISVKQGRGGLALSSTHTGRLLRR